MQRFWQEVDRDRNGISVLRDRFRGIVTSVLKVATSKAVWILRNLLRNWAAAGTVPNSSGVSGEVLQLDSCIPAWPPRWYLKYFTVAQQAGPIEAFYASCQQKKPSYRKFGDFLMLRLQCCSTSNILFGDILVPIITPIMENQMEQKMENEMEPGII